MRKVLISVALLMLMLNLQCYAEIHFDLVRTEVEPGEPVYDLDMGGVINHSPNGYIWSENIPIPVVSELPTPNIIDLGNKYKQINGYITKVGGIYYWTGRTGEAWSSLLRWF